MAGRNNTTPPPESSRPFADGGASEKSQLDWVLNSQSQMKERLAVIETNSEHTAKSLDRFELAMEKQSEALIASLEKQSASQEKAFEKLCATQEKSFEKQCAMFEKSLDKQSVDIKKVDSDMIKVVSTIKYAAGALAATALILGLIINGQFGKFSNFMDEQQKKESQKVVSPKTDQGK
ncbi:protein of unknown function [Shewanella benthica]|uniref:Uncharacterized protein n=1 Tax=Shewanella benthica TaxID=43661 RepID=A0A330M0K1_9GAMM|nr:hypothetical protein [Shewanella benthica]SQH75084.1 protein of unknown function [Shewanella benthica]